MALLRSYLFAPGNSEKLLQKVFTGGADAVVLDLEDAVPAGEKAQARRMVGALLERQTGPSLPVYVRINGMETGLWREDLAAVVGPGLRGIRLPKAESAADVGRFVDVLQQEESRKGLAPGAIEVICTIETARGVCAAQQLAACPRVANLTFGAADFAQDAGLDPGDDETETLMARSQLVLASRAAGIDPPVASVFTRVHDDEGLRRSTESARRLGFFGRSVIHPRQLPVVHEVFTPAAEAVARAREIVEVFEDALSRGSGTALTGDGRFVDFAVARRARSLLALAESLETARKKGKT